MSRSNPYVFTEQGIYMLMTVLKGDLAVQRNESFLQKVMKNFIDPSTFKHFLILNGQRLEADVAYTQIYGMAKRSVLIVDDYLDAKTLDLLRCVAKGITVKIFSEQHGRTRLTERKNRTGLLIICSRLTTL